MPADEQFWGLSVNFTLNQRTVMIRITADMRHPDIQALALKTLVPGIYYAHIFSINIAINTAQWLKGRKLIGQLDIAKIAGMPNLVTILEMFENGIVKIAVRIRY